WRSSPDTGNGERQLEHAVESESRFHATALARRGLPGSEPRAHLLYIGAFAAFFLDLAAAAVYSAGRERRTPEDTRREDRRMADLNRPRTGADLLVRRLRAHGVRHVFGYPGGQLMPLYDALYREPDIRHVLARDEQAAGFMADGQARATGK